ncbi:DUF2490 domain-containing protein [Flavobacteriaceae bacterium S0862]|nr:DUF2490 domain-containing protein [Flavobacteriaceae bacterium S0862]
MKKIKTNLKSKITLLVFALALPLIGFSQESNLGNWLIYIGNKKLNSKWNIHNEVQYRNYNAIGDLEQLILRTGIGYNITEKNNILLGYGYILSENYVGNTDDKVSVNEHRIFQQYTTKQSIGKVKLSHRYRFEQRFVEEDFKLRFRYFLSLNVPLKNNESGGSLFYLSAYNEIFLNSKSSIFDRNRLYGGLGYNVNKNVRIELGYMNQFFETTSRDQLNLITFVTF